MQKVFYEVSSLDKNCYDNYGLSEDLLMEHAANAMLSFIDHNFEPHRSVLVVCGPGNNGADGIALARLLHGKYKVKMLIPFGAKSPMAKLQLERAKKVGLKPVGNIDSADIIVDALFGSGLNKELDSAAIKLIRTINAMPGYKLACDIPSGINADGIISPVCFKAEATITMGALKTSLFSDQVKDFVGKIAVANLGVQRSVYENESNIFLLAAENLVLPVREHSNTHKGNYGHLSVILGDKKGAGLLAASSAFAFGAGLVSIIAHEELELPYHIMQSHQIPDNTTAIAIGMGLGKYNDKEIEDILALDIAKVIDADLFYDNKILTQLERGDVVLTPHPKEFCSLLKICGIADIDVNELQKNRFKYVLMFEEKYPRPVLLLKGANVLIANEGGIFINHLGTTVISKGGSGDVLTGLTGSLLAQGHTALHSAINASLAHAMAARNFELNNYALEPQDIIEGVKKL